MAGINSTFPWNQANVMVQDYIIPTIADQIFLSNALFNRMKGRVKDFTGGRRIVVPLGWKTQGGLRWFNGADVFSPQVRDPFQAAEFTPKNANVDITIDWEEEKEAQGKEKVMDLMEAKGEWARSTFFDGMATELFNNGSQPNALAGLQYALKDFTGTTASPVAPTMTYGMISRSSTVNTWWNHQGDPGSYTTGAGGTFCTDQFSAMSRMFARIKLASGKAPTMIVGNVGAFADAHYNLVKTTSYFKPQQNNKLAEIGFENVMFRNATWVADEKCPRTAGRVEHVYVIYEPSTRLYVDTTANFAFEPFRKPANQMVRTAYILWRGELIINEPRANGVFSSVDCTNVS